METGLHSGNNTSAFFTIPLTPHHTVHVAAPRMERERERVVYQESIYNWWPLNSLLRKGTEIHAGKPMPDIWITTENLDIPGTYKTLLSCNDMETCIWKQQLST